jgi:hypothetical protein
MCRSSIFRASPFSSIGSICRDGIPVLEATPDLGNDGVAISHDAQRSLGAVEDEVLVAELVDLTPGPGDQAVVELVDDLLNVRSLTAVLQLVPSAE